MMENHPSEPLNAKAVRDALDAVVPAGVFSYTILALVQRDSSLRIQAVSNVPVHGTMRQALLVAALKQEFGIPTETEFPKMLRDLATMLEEMPK